MIVIRYFPCYNVGYDEDRFCGGSAADKKCADP